MSTLRISNIEAKSVPASATIDEKVKITNSSGDVLVFLDGKTSGITTVGINTTDPNITFDANSNVVVTGIITATRFSGQITPTSLEIGSNIKLGNAGVITATSFVGSGANLTSLPSQLTLSNNADNRVITGGSGVNLNGEANLTFDGAELAVSGTGIRVDRNGGNPYIDFRSSSASEAYIYGGTSGLQLFTKPSGGSIAERVRIGAGGSVTHYCGSANSEGFLVLGHASQGRTTLAVRAGNTNSNASTSIRLQHANGTSVGSLFLDNDGNNYNMMNAVQGGQIVFHTNESGSSLPKMRIHPDGDVQITSGNLVVPSGNGIDFSATNNSTASGASMNNELFDDYEKGTFTPVMYGNSTGTGSNTVSGDGYYVKVGDTCTITINFSNKNGSNLPSGSEQMRIAGLPFAFHNGAGNQTSAVPFTYKVGFNTAHMYTFIGANNNNYLRGYVSRDSNTWTPWTIPSWRVSQFYLIVNMTYLTV